MTIVVGERDELVARGAALVGREPREHARDADLDLDLLGVLLRHLDRLEQRERLLRLAGARPRLGDDADAAIARISCALRVVEVHRVGALARIGGAAEPEVELRLAAARRRPASRPGTS